MFVHELFFRYSAVNELTGSGLSVMKRNILKPRVCLHFFEEWHTSDVDLFTHRKCHLRPKAASIYSDFVNANNPFPRNVSEKSQQCPVILLTLNILLFVTVLRSFDFCTTVCIVFACART